MNEHTKLLIMKAGGIICSTEGSAVVDKIDYLHFDAEKFAQLLVNKCADIANQQFEAATGLNDRDSWTAAEMKKHFGVKE
jgi:hypothetical protein